MSIRHLEEAKQLKEIGKIMGREAIAKRVLFCVDMMLKDTHYQGVIEFVGRMKAIAQACNSDDYWREKCNHGFSKEFDDLRYDKKNYYGYCGKKLHEEVQS